MEGAIVLIFLWSIACIGTVVGYESNKKKKKRVRLTRDAAARRTAENDYIEVVRARRYSDLRMAEMRMEMRMAHRPCNLPTFDEIFGEEEEEVPTTPEPYRYPRTRTMPWS